MVKKNDSNQLLVKEADYIVMDLGWENYIILPWELGIQFMKAMASGVRLNGSLDLNKESNIKIHEAHETELKVRGMTQETFDALRMKALVTGE